MWIPLEFIHFTVFALTLPVAMKSSELVRQISHPITGCDVTANERDFIATHPKEPRQFHINPISGRSYEETRTEGTRGHKMSTPVT
ncbi:hypothetical protein J6590_020424 [Homalodisca vitripennis]|nr:hypothetical protein J6590_020424 [Homalodisca vitripennis]